MLQLHINKLKVEALGNYRTMLHTVAKDAAMLEFLNNTQNRARKPNENFAREVLELYTLGIGQYTEQDIKEAARAFTGWNYDDAGAFWLVERWHDTGTKTFRGKTGAFGGEDILNRVLDDPATAAFLAKNSMLGLFPTSPIPNVKRKLRRFCTAAVMPLTKPCVIFL